MEGNKTYSDNGKIGSEEGIIFVCCAIIFQKERSEKEKDKGEKKGGSERLHI
jgi:hypothetical protein